MKKFGKNWFAWALLFLVAVTLFGPSMVAHAAPPTAQDRIRLLIESLLGGCGGTM